MTMVDLNKKNFQELAYALELVFNDVLDDEEIAESIEDMIEQWRDTPEFARTIRDQWRQVIDDEPPEIAQYLVLELSLIHI